ncbi:Peptidase S26A, signal peptidase I [Roseobacter sp. SK209-2-6]|uniref:signal peptidase I n=1 Tax=Roseobacter sp. SK209-2-6 TaxID=388739 RepID=UPI0000F3CFB3|nr:signal peptidase I [Roseobacter sp. SK209-2-6]EBA15180.1 Peptidase S26A, signal peptidase I [Roseobacter sp. SK209-2-6]
MWKMTGEAMAPALDSNACKAARLLDPKAEPPVHGDVVVFKHPVKLDTPMVFRVIALGGDTVQMVQGKILLNGQALPQSPIAPLHRNVLANPHHRCGRTADRDGSCLVDRYVETLPNGRAYEILDLGWESLDNTASLEVPMNHLFVLGDHRDNSADSRLPHSSGGLGFVPIGNVTAIFDDL